MRRIRLFATDLDGTLVHPDVTISDRTTKAMEHAASQGVEVVWATGRAKISVSELARSCGFTGIAICSNGAVVLDLSGTDAVVMDVAELEPGRIKAAIDHIRAIEPATVFATAGLDEFVAEPGYAELCAFGDHHREREEMTLSAELPSTGDPVVKLTARHPGKTSAELHALIAGSGIEGVELTYSGAPFIEMAREGVSKASALATLCRARGIDAEEVAAAGDSLNDVAMLTWAGTALCPANALPEVLALADQVIPANHEDGVASYLEGLVRPGTSGVAAIFGGEALFE